MPPKQSKKTGVHGFGKVGGKTVSQKVKTTKNKVTKTGQQTLGNMAANAHDRKNNRQMASEKTNVDVVDIEESEKYRDALLEPHLDAAWDESDSSDEFHTDREHANSDDEAESVTSMCEDNDEPEGVVDRYDEDYNLVKEKQNVDYSAVEEAAANDKKGISRRHKAYRKQKLSNQRLLADSIHIASLPEGEEAPGDVQVWDDGGYYDLVPDEDGDIEALGGGVYRDINKKELMKRIGATKNSGRIVDAIPTKVIKGEGLKKVWETLKNRRERAEKRAKMKAALHGAHHQGDHGDDGELKHEEPDDEK